MSQLPFRCQLCPLNVPISHTDARSSFLSLWTYKHTSHHLTPHVPFPIFELLRSTCLLILIRVSPVWELKFIPKQPCFLCCLSKMDLVALAFSYDYTNYTCVVFSPTQDLLRNLFYCTPLKHTLTPIVPCPECVWEREKAAWGARE